MTAPAPATAAPAAPGTTLTLHFLEEVPNRALTFLRAAGTVPAIRSILESNGYDEEEHAQGWTLIHAVSGYKPGKSGFGITVDTAVRDAANEVDSWDEPNFARIKAALERKFPTQAEFVFANDLKPAQGPASLVTVTTLLDRLDALQSGKDRAKTHKQDLASLALLTRRGYTTEVRARLRGLIKTAQEGTAVPAAPPAGTPPASDKEREEYLANLVALHAWYKDWTTTAHDVVTRRDYKISLGIAKRKTSEKASAAVPAPVVPVPAPATPASK